MMKAQRSTAQDRILVPKNGVVFCKSNAKLKRTDVSMHALGNEELESFLRKRRSASAFLHCNLTLRSVLLQIQRAEIHGSTKFQRKSKIKKRN